jgi:Xaa-Pro dipeptidase
MHLAPGMAFSCEPGIYIRGEIGIRIEDVVIINEKGETEILNKCTKELIEIC